MSVNTRFAVAVHILTLLASNEGEPATSEHIAGSVNTNPAVVRRLLMSLARAGLTSSQLGAGGGALLAKPPRAITLRDVFRAVSDGTLLPIHEAPNPKCRVGRNIQRTLEGHLDAATIALESQLAEHTIADMLSEVVRADRSRRSVAR